MYRGVGGFPKYLCSYTRGEGGLMSNLRRSDTVLHQNEDFDILLSQIEMSCKCLQNSTWGEGGSKSPKNCLRSLCTAPQGKIK